MTEAFWTACEQAGYRVHREGGTVDGLLSGVAFRVTPAVNTVTLSVNLAEKQRGKLQQKWQELCAGLTVGTTDGCAVALTCPTLENWEFARLQSLLETVTADAVQGATHSFTDRHEKERDPFFAYVRGFFGALLGAVVGALPWFLARQMLGFNLWFLAAGIGIASFYGYRLFGGAHATGYATALVVVFSLLTAAGLLLGSDLALQWMLREVYAEVEQAWWMLDATPSEFVLRLLGDGAFWQAELGNLAFPLVAVAAGLVGIRRQILVYTHEGAYLRRGKKRR